MCGVSVRIRGFDQNIIQIWNMDSELHSKSTVSKLIGQCVAASTTAAAAGDSEGEGAHS